MAAFCSPQVTAQSLALQSSTQAPGLKTLQLSADESSRLKRQRELYAQARKAFSGKRIEEFKRLSAQLEDYPLYPYLQYQLYRKRPQTISAQAVKAFERKYADSPLAWRLKHLRLDYLADNKRWSDYLSQVSADTSNTIQQCQRLWALYQTGKQQQALSQVSPLWVVGYSQPKKCDPIFNRWLKSSHFDEKYAWQRFWLALERGQRVLARYLLRFIDNTLWKRSAQTALNLHRLPQRLAETDLSPKLPGYSEIIFITLKRLVPRDGAMAVAQWQKHHKQLKLSPEDTQALSKYLGLYLLQSYHPQSEGWLQILDKQFADSDLKEWRLRFHLSEHNWDKIQQLMTLLRKEELEQGRWRYWKARALEELGDQASADRLFRQLAQERSFYGFLSAERLGLPFQLNDTPHQPNDRMIKELSRNDALLRARELYHHRQYLDARREWWQSGRQFSKEQHATAGLIAHHWGLHNLAIRSAISAGNWDNMLIRFPTPYNGDIHKNAERFGIDGDWIYAVARQESAFAADIRSHAGAVGLMQLMPATAKQTAYKLNVRYRGSFELTRPDYNIRLGSAYLAKLLKRFNDNRVYATAAYNAGPHRVKRWLKERDDLPADAWIETIPYNETRHYVQNVLSFAAIYSEIRGNDSAFLHPHERPAPTKGNQLAQHP